jgi:hypothetical protein
LRSARDCRPAGGVRRQLCFSGAGPTNAPCEQKKKTWQPPSDRPIQKIRSCDFERDLEAVSLQWTARPIVVDSGYPKNSILISGLFVPHPLRGRRLLIPIRHRICLPRKRLLDRAAAAVRKFGKRPTKWHHMRPPVRPTLRCLRFASTLRLPDASVRGSSGTADEFILMN